MFDNIKLMPAKKTKMVLYVVFIILFALVTGVIYYALQTGEKSSSKEAQRIINNTKDNKPPLVVEQPQVKIAKEVNAKTFQELKETAPDIVTSPNVSDAKLREEILKDVKNEDPQNYRVFFDGAKISATELTISQGDYVTWVNNSNGKTMKVEGKDNWGSILEVPPSKGFTQEFNFKGDFEYTINGSIKGKISVK